MSILSQLELVFGVREQAPSPDGVNWHAPTVDLTGAGYPGFHWTAFFLTPAGAERYRSMKAIAWPDSCVACGRPVKAARTCQEVRGFRPVVWKGRPLCTNVPYCDEHAEGGSHLAMSVHHTRSLTSVSVIAKREEFLRKTLLQVQRDGEHEPPWLTFPGALPWIGWNQGTNEAWLDRAFRPFWATLSASERKDYLFRWQAPPDWAEWLRSWE
ncbi:MAG: hypothetical protein JW751_03345 [Polyangiaceae bacterium]|nr:hypothetical protein [Polyangiaceae bacterium]